MFVIRAPFCPTPAQIVMMALSGVLLQGGADSLNPAGIVKNGKTDGVSWLGETPICPSARQRAPLERARTNWSFLPCLIP